MAKVTTGKRTALRMDDLGINLDGTVIPSSSNVRIDYGNGDYTDFGGTFTFLPGGQFTGTVNAISHVVGGKAVFSVANANADAMTLFALIDSGDILGAQAYVLRGADKINGNSQDDVLYGFGGDDIIQGGAGDDVLVGGGGLDRLSGGGGPIASPSGRPRIPAPHWTRGTSSWASVTRRATASTCLRSTRTRTRQPATTSSGLLRSSPAAPGS